MYNDCIYVLFYMSWFISRERENDMTEENIRSLY